MPTLPLETLVSSLRSCWDARTSFTPTEWAAANPARGQCLVSALVVQDYYGGDIRRYRVKGAGFEETHYCNVLYDGTLLVDATGCQYTSPVTLTTTKIDLHGYASARERYLSDPQTSRQYALLSRRVKLRQAQHLV